MKLTIFLYALIGCAMAWIGSVITELIFYQYGEEEVICALLKYLIVMLFVCTGILRHTILHAGEKKKKEKKKKEKKEPSEEEVQEEQKNSHKVSHIDSFFRHY